uniref:translation initiation factor IF-2-like n=1 Tax=Nyctereutes procyonoides TaxID=34880 RepID=UPI002443F1BA|nr:translation initiation factor IF-2-like [Nyctereutes procyonoides]
MRGRSTAERGEREPTLRLKSSLGNLQGQDRWAEAGAAEGTTAGTTAGTTTRPRPRRARPSPPVTETGRAGCAEPRPEQDPERPRSSPEPGHQQSVKSWRGARSLPGRPAPAPAPAPTPARPGPAAAAAAAAALISPDPAADGSRRGFFSRTEKRIGNPILKTVHCTIRSRH